LLDSRHKFQAVPRSSLEMAMASLFGFARRVGLGVAAAYFFDPKFGRNRRAKLRDAVLDVASKIGCEVRSGWQDLSNRGRSLIDESQSRLGGDEKAESELAKDIDSRIGHYISRPDLVNVTVRGTRAKLAGKVLGTEKSDLVAAVMSSPGVKAVDQRLDVYDSIAELADSEGSKNRGNNQTAVMNTPAIRFIIGAAGVLLTLRALGIGRTLGLVAATTATIRSLRQSAERDAAEFEDENPQRFEEPVDEAIDESFPASDPPSFTSSAASRSAEPGEVAEDTPWKTPPVEK
jgi:hypothetical protein